MGSRISVHDGTGTVADVPGLGIIDCYGSTVPADASVGYATGCLFHHTDGGDGTSLYVNEGDVDSSSFKAIDVALGIDTSVVELGASGVLTQVTGVGIMDAYGDTVPVDTTTGYVTGCTFRKSDGGNGTSLYVNEGDADSALFKAIIAAD